MAGEQGAGASEGGRGRRTRTAELELPTSRWIDGTSWVAVRCFEADTSETPWRMGFAYSSPVHIEMPGKPLRPRKIETDFFVRRMNEEIERNREVLRPDELAEYERALDIYGDIATTAINDTPTEPAQPEWWWNGWGLALVDPSHSSLAVRPRPCIVPPCHSTRRQAAYIRPPVHPAGHAGRTCR